ncbi:MAG: LptF/LptG family permease [Saprospiraceae bacterium]|nr:LptF/LptG family permease [Saprospiraceae bacterium]
MLTKLDWYIIKKYLVTFAFTILMITIIAICIDFFEKVDKFQAADTTVKRIILDYYLNFIPWINGLLWPLFALLAVIFFTSRLARESEIISMLAAGVSYDRIMRPFFIAATFLAVLLWLGNNFLIPNSNRIKNEFESEYIKRTNKSTLASDQHFFISPQEKAYFRIFSSRDSTAYNFRVETFDGSDLIKIFKADRITYIPDSNKWKATSYEIHTIDSLREHFQIFTDSSKMIAYPFKPDDFVRYAKQMEMLSTHELRQFIEGERAKGLDTAKKYVIELYRRTADPFTIIILTIIGVSVASRKVRGGMGFHLATGIIIGAAFVILSKFTVTFASNLSLPAGLGVWVPNIVFTFVAYYLYLRAQK